MNAEPFWPNEIVESKADGTRCRLLAFEKQTDRAWLIELENKKSLPFKENYSGLTLVYRRPEKTDAPTPAVVLQPTPGQKAVADRAMARIAPLVKNLEILDKETRWKLLEERSRELKHQAQVSRLPDKDSPRPPTGTPKVLLEDLRAYWQRGQSPAALLGDYKRGKAEKSGLGTANRGRPAEERPNYQLMARDYRWMEIILVKHYLKENSRVTLKKALRLLHAEYYTHTDGNGKIWVNPEGEKPSYAQLRWFLLSKWPDHVRLRARVGDKRYEQNHRGTPGSVDQDCHGVSHIYEIDATIVDVYLVSTQDKRNIVGKPTMYLIVDRYSRLIVGWYVGFENANISSAMQAVLTLFEDKEAICQRLGLEHDKRDWPAHGVPPEVFLADQGTFVHKESRPMAVTLRSHIKNVPGLRPDWKSIVEGRFNLTHQEICMTPGYQPDAETRARRNSGADQEAAMNIHQFEAVIVESIIRHNRSMLKKYPMSVDQVNEGIRPIPRELYAYGIESRMGQLDKMDYQVVRDELLPRREHVSVTKDGVFFEKMHYTCKDIEELGWLSRARRGVFHVTIAFDYRLVDEIRVFHPDGSGAYFVLHLSKNSAQFAGMSLADVQRHFKREKELKGEASALTDQENFEYDRSTQARNAAAKKALKQDVGNASRRSRKVDTKPARQQELDTERQRIAGAGHQVGKTRSSTSQPLAEETKVLDGADGVDGVDGIEEATGKQTRASALVMQLHPAATPESGNPTAQQEAGDTSGAQAASEASQQPKPTPPPMSLKERLAAKGRAMRNAGAIP